MARISMTGLVSALIPDVVERRDVDWMRSEWQRDFGGPVRLSYKGGFFLLGMPRDRENTLVSRTISHLAEDQNEDGGFAPWRGHPIGSDPWSTGVVLWGLSKWIGHVDPVVVEKALHWLGKTQLPSGYWPYHYLDDGTSLALIGAVYAMKASAAGKSSCAPLS
ncbi:MAG TPA: terpene cyclase/mutase family protein [Syntrophales bacterium]|nr:terpene cyclase/mutase family protein [Syntrophales bacterium]HOM08220.1 terpene cyclase/mutase family protein [Syntrophales bacterium]